MADNNDAVERSSSSHLDATAMKTSTDIPADVYLVTTGADANGEVTYEQRRATDAPDIDQGWAWVVLLASWMSQLFGGGAITAIGIFHVYLLKAFDEDSTKTAWVGSLFSGLTCVLGPVSSVICNVFTLRHSMVVGGFIASLGLAISSQMGSLNLMFITFGLLAGFGMALVYTPAVIIPGYYFVRRRSLAFGASVTGLPLGIIVTPRVLELLEYHYGWRGSILIFAGILFNLCLFGVMMRPSTLERQTKSRAVITSTEDMKKAFRKLCSFDAKFLKNIPFWCLSFALMSNCFGMNIVYLHLPSYSFSMGADELELTQMFLCMGVGSICARTLAGLGTNDIKGRHGLNRTILMIGCNSILCLSSALFPLYADTSNGRAAYSGIFGFYFGVVACLLPGITMELVGLNTLSTAFGIEMLFMGVGMILGPPIAGLMRDVTGKYEHSFILAGVIFLVSAISFMAMVTFRKPESLPENGPATYEPCTRTDS